MSFPRSSIDKGQSVIDKDGGGLHVTNLELPTLPSSPGVVPPRYSFLSTRRFSAAPFRRARPNANPNGSETRPPTESVANVSPLAPSIASAPSTSGEPMNLQGVVNDEKEAHRETETILDRRWFGWTWRRWAFILGPCIAIVVMAVVLVAVFVTRNNNDNYSSGSGAASTTTSNGATPTLTLGPSPTPSNPALNGGVIDGTALVATNTDHDPKPKTWLFYQNAAGNLVYIPMLMNNSWGTPQLLPVTTSVLNGTALTAFNYKDNNLLKINFIYQDATGTLNNLLYTGNSKQFTEGLVHVNNISLPTSPDVIKRMSWGSIPGNYNFLYYTGTDGLLHEYTYNMKTNIWASTYTFPNSNGYSGCAMSNDANNSIITLHTISSTGQLQMYWRNYTLTNSTQGTPAAPISAWNTGGTLPNAQTQLGFKLDINSTLSYSQFNNGELFMQEDQTGVIWRVGWTGIGENQTYTSAVTTDQNAQLSTDLFTIPALLWNGRKDQAHSFVQEPGGNIAHMVQQDDGSFKIVEYVPT